MPVVGYTGTETCPGCGLVWEYDEGTRPTMESVRALVAAEQKRCAVLADGLAAEYRADGQIDWAEVAECVARRIREGGVPT
jgi:hypothetical protein